MVLVLEQTTNRYFKFLTKRKIYKFNDDEHDIQNLMRFLLNKYRVHPDTVDYLTKFIYEIHDDHTIPYMPIYNETHLKYNIKLFYRV
jgi:hypothetical protein